MYVIIMQKQGILCQKASSSSLRLLDQEQLDLAVPIRVINWKVTSQHNTPSKFRATSSTTSIRISPKIKSTPVENIEQLSDEDDDELCPVDCVREFKNDEEFLRILDKAKESNALVVVDFYRTSCGSCKYIEQGFAKLCKGSGDEEAPVIFLKHNVLDEYDEQSEVAERLRIRTVPLFHFYKNGVLLEAFPTRDKERILEAILKYTAPASTGGG